ncbi:MAG TPA: hypothetical protein PK509_15950 [Catalimonadaceae bacterium]|nr:hypothetical protein [Catalimonadaceae bacterium]
MYEYETDKITDPLVCDNLIEEATADLELLTEDKQILEIEEGKADTTTSDVAGEITATINERAALQAAIPSLIPSKQRAYQRKIVRLGHRLDNLGVKQEDKGANRLLRKQYELGKIDVLMAEANRFIQLVTARKAVLVQAAS